MPQELDLSRSVHDLASQNPGFTQVMASIGFTDITKPAALETVGRVMTVPRGCAIKGISLDDAVRAFEDAGFTVVNAGERGGEASGATPSTTGEKPAGTSAESASAGSAADPAAAQDDAAPTESASAAPAPTSLSPSPSDAASHNAPATGEKVEGLDEAGRAKLLESYVARLSAGERLESVRADFVANFADVDAGEIARAEQSLIEGGARIDDVQRLCDVHSALFHGSTREERIANAEEAVMGSLASGSGADDFKTKVLSAIPGHPVHVLAAENEAIASQSTRTRKALGTDAATDELRTLSALGIHYAKKGDLIYPILKLRHGYSGPSDVMWGVDDEIRAELGSLLAASERDASWLERANALLTRIDEMTYKEANILLPLCAQNLTDDEWLQMYVDMRGYDLCLIKDAGTWQTGERYLTQWSKAAEGGMGVSPASDSDGVATPGEVRLASGSLTVAQLDAMLNTLPLEVTFVDGDDINRYWNDDGEKKLFKRPPSALGREVWSCHPPKIQPMVRSVIQTLRSGSQDSVDVWMQKEGEPVLVRYMAVRDRSGAYLGTLEVVQRMGFARDHFGA
ncbi:DUF438 domain-containing protein [Olsenella porci]|uniref:DUF438 domain-containing protein n=1 Tax=Olsenella porci TaxID=2652279 RepID=A0A6N7XEL9_9ACTN|nr:DUF438 domain-containing protein [Olsenella porci]MST72783.1 DUF438 domain-containing protein [Olsenella porci]